MKVFPEQTRIQEALRPVLPSIQWALAAARRGVESQYDPATGHDRTIRGHLLHNQVCDRLDRAFSAGNYQRQAGSESPIDDSALFESLSQDEIESMPNLKPGVVRREDVNQSPAWRFGDITLLPQSFTAEPFESWVWSQRSRKTKRNIAQIEYDFDGQPGDQMHLGIGPDLLPAGDFLIIGYRYTGTTFEAGIGVARDNKFGGRPWHWFTKLDPWKPTTILVPESELLVEPHRINRNVSLKRESQQSK